MYEHDHPGPKMGELIGVDLVRMDGMEGLLFVAEKIGALMMEKPEQVDEGLLFFHSTEILGEEAFLNRWRGPAPRALVLGSTGPWPSSGTNLAARGLIAATDSQERLAHLRIFGLRRFPLGVSALLALVGVAEDRIGLATVKALTQVTHPDVRALAFRLMETKDPARAGAIGLLSSNYVDGDHAVMLRWFEEEDDRDIRHSMGRDLINYWRRYPEGDAEALMPRALYEKGPCSFCRESAVRGVRLGCELSHSRVGQSYTTGLGRSAE